MAHEEFTRIVEGSDTAVLMVHGICGTPNEYRSLFNMAPYEGGDQFVMRLDTQKTGDTAEENKEE